MESGTDVQVWFLGEEFFFFFFPPSVNLTEEHCSVESNYMFELGYLGLNLKSNKWHSSSTNVSIILKHSLLFFLSQ